MTKFLIATLATMAIAAGANAGSWDTPPTQATKRDAGRPEPRWKKSVDAETMKQYEKTAQAVWKKIFENAVIVPGKNWPSNLTTTPIFLIVDEVKFGKRSDEYNAVAHVLCDENGIPVKKDGKLQSVIEFTRGYLELLKGSEHGIALVLGHELGHHALGHTTQGRPSASEALAAIDSHRREADADMYGARLMLKAGYSLRKGVIAEWIGLDKQGWTSSAASATCKSHPSTSDRAARLSAVLDKNEAELWRCMSAFENGVTFLEVQNFAAAEDCFLRVVKEFPKCHEAWANLGLARLLRYCDGLSAEDIRLLDVGHFLGTAYRTAGTIPLLRSGRTELWYSAVNALMNAKELMPNSPQVLSNLALAYLLHPAGKDVGTALEFRTAAEKAFEKATDLPSQVRLGMLVNFAVIHLANGDSEKGQKLLAEAVTLAERRVYGEVANWPLTLRGAVAFNKAVALKNSDRRAAVEEFEKFLMLTPRSNPWWPGAYEQYASLCKAEGTTTKEKAKLGNIAVVRMQQIVTLKTGGTVYVGQAVEEAIKVLGEPNRKSSIEGTSVCRLQFDAHGLYLVADDDEVFAIVITSATGPKVVLQEFGPGGKVLGELRVGMTRVSVRNLPGRGSPVRLGFLAKDADGNAVEYDYYPDLGVAVLYDAAGVVRGLLIGQLAR
ncbi:MAG: hypothetical protein C0467_20410 [Planctomycetaceae bacterium]|nr:hypothetical protein [Planctomycetaceae bacterium]